MNKYCNLDGYKKIKDDFQNINIGFDRVEEDVDKINNDVKNIDDRVDTIITTPVEGVSAQEIVDARKGKPTLGDKIQSIDDSLESHKVEKASQAKLGHIKLQENFINGTLQNGWDGTLQYAKNDLGQVTMQGTILPGSVSNGVTICTLPQAYKPSYMTPFVVYEHTVGRSRIGFVLHENGNLILYRPAVDEISETNEISFNMTYQI